MTQRMFSLVAFSLLQEDAYRQEENASFSFPVPRHAISVPQRSILFQGVVSPFLRTLQFLLQAQEALVVLQQRLEVFTNRVLSLEPAPADMVDLLKEQREIDGLAANLYFMADCALAEADNADCLRDSGGRLRQREGLRRARSGSRDAR